MIKLQLLQRIISSIMAFFVIDGLLAESLKRQLLRNTTTLRWFSALTMFFVISAFNVLVQAQQLDHTFQDSEEKSKSVNFDPQLRSLLLGDAGRMIATGKGIPKGTRPGYLYSFESAPKGFVHALTDAELRVKSFFSQSDIVDRLWEMFPGHETENPSLDWMISAQNLVSNVLNEKFSTEVRFVGFDILNGAMAGFIGDGPSGESLILVNSDWLEMGISHHGMVRLALEEIGHSFDWAINGQFDSPGDEGELFAAMVLGDVLDADVLARIHREYDLNEMWLDGVLYDVEEASITFAAGFIALSTTSTGASIGTGLRYTSDPDGTTFQTSGTGITGSLVTDQGTVLGTFSRRIPGGNTSIEAALFDITTGAGSLAAGTQLWLVLTNVAAYGPNVNSFPSNVSANAGSVASGLDDYVAQHAAIAANSILTANPTSIVANGLTTSIITVQLNNGTSNITPGGGTVVLNTTLGTISAVIDNGNGTYTATLTSSTSAGTATITGTYFGIDFTGTAFTNNAQVAFTAGPAANIAINDGDGQSATAGTAVATAPSVLVTDENDNPVSGYSVTFVVASGGGGVTGATTTTNSSGIATVGSWTLGTTAGTNNNTLTATSTGLTGSPLTFTATGTVGGADATESTLVAAPLAITTDESSTLTVQIKDAAGNNLGAGVEVFFALTDGDGSLSAGPWITDANGQVSATLTSGTINTVEVTGYLGTDTTGDVIGTADVTVGLGAADAEMTTATVPAGTAGTPTTITISVNDAQGNPISGAGGLIGISIGGANEGATVSSITDNGDGVPDPTDITIVTVREGPAVSGNSDANVPDGDVGRPTTIIVSLFDEFGNPVFDGANQISISVSDGPNAGADFTVVDNGDGTYSLTYTPQESGTDFIEILINGEPLDGSPFPSQVRSLEAAKLVMVSGDNQFGVILTTLSSPLEVRVLDATDRSVSETTVQFELISSPTNSVDAVIITPAMESDENGLALTRFIPGNLIGVYQIRAFVDGLEPVLFTINAIPCVPNFDAEEQDVCGPYNYAVTASNYTPNISETVTITAQLVDRFGNPTPVAGINVNWATSNIGEFASTTTTTNEAGFATVNYIVTGVVGTLHIVTASDEYNNRGTADAIIAHGGGIANIHIAGHDTVQVGLVQGIFELILLDEFDNEIVANRDLIFQMTIVDGSGFEVYNDLEGNPIDRNTNNQLVIRQGMSRTPFHLKQNTSNLKRMTAVGVADLNWLDGEKMVFLKPDEESIVLSLIAGNGQHERVFEQLVERLIVTLIDQYDNPIPNRLITFQLVDTPQFAEDMHMFATQVVANKSTIASNDFSEYRVELFTDSTGRASVYFVLGSKAGDYFIEATTPGVNSVMFVATALPNKYVLHQNYPNPFNAGTKILYDVPVESNVTITIYDVLGRQVATLVNEVKPTGLHTINLDMNRIGLTSGVYI